MNFDLPLTAQLIHLTLFTAGVVDAVLFLFLFSRRKPGPIFATLNMHILGVLGWAFAVLALLITESAIAAALSYFFGVIFSVSKYFFVLSFPENKLPVSRWHYLTLIPAGALLPLSLVPGLVFGDISVINSSYTTVENGPFSGFYAVVIMYFLVAPLFFLWRKEHSYAPHSLMRRQLRYLFWAFAITFLLGLLTNLVLPVFFGVYILNGIGPAFCVILVGFIAYIITRHQFLDIRPVIQQSITYAMLLLLTVGMYLVFVTVFGYFFQQATHVASMLSAVVTMVLGIFGTPIIERHFKRLTNPLFFRDPYDYAEVAGRLTHILNRNIDLDIIERETSEEIVRALKSEYVIFMFPSKSNGTDQELAQKLKVLWSLSARVTEKAFPYSSRALIVSAQRVTHTQNTENSSDIVALFDRYNAELLVPITLEEKFLGALMLGPKRSEVAYSKMDIQLLENFTEQFAVAFEKSLLYEQVSAYSVDLEKKITERTAEIIALRENERQMMTEIAHGLQTPLTLLKSELEMLTRKFPNLQGVENLDRSVEMVSQFVYNLLALSRLEQGHSDEDRELVNLSALLLETVEYVTTLIEQEGIVIRSMIADDVVVLGSKRQLTEVVVNLLSNAIKYMSPERIKEITVSLECIKGDAIFAVSDTGVGIFPADIPRLFERFFRTSCEATKRKKGTGLGLAITRTIVAQHQGTISVVSTPGIGSTFSVRLPSVPHDNQIF